MKKPGELEPRKGLPNRVGRGHVWAREREREVNDCLVSAYRSYSATWQVSCEKAERSLGCFLPRPLAAALTEGLEKTQELCVKKYK